MATATATPSVNSYPNGIDNGQRFLYVFGTVAIAASPDTYATGGLAVSWDTLSADGGFELPVGPDDITAPVEVNVYSKAGSGYVYPYDYSTNKLMILVQGAAAGDPLAEMANATAIPAAVSGDTIGFKATFVKMRG